MQITWLEVGQRPPSDSDCIRIEETQEGRFALTGTALCQQGDETESVSIIGTQDYGAIDEAEQAGIVWAAVQLVDKLYVGYGTLALPIALAESDRPL